MHVAELNIAKARYDLDDPRMQDFLELVAGVNELADRSPGFVWRLKDDTGAGAVGIKASDDPRLMVNMSVWETPEALENYVWQTVHKRVYNRKNEWFDHIPEASLVMWAVEPGHVPTLAEALGRLEHLRKHGSSEFAYGWEGLPHLKQWLAKKCG